MLDRLQKDGAILEHRLKPEDLRVWHKPTGDDIHEPAGIDVSGPVSVRLRRTDFCILNLELLDIGMRPVGQGVTKEIATVLAWEYLRWYAPPAVALEAVEPETYRWNEAGPAEFPVQPGWRVGWSRAYGGYQFRIDSCGVRTTNDGQFRWFGLTWRSRHPPTLEVRIPRERAETLGREGAHVIMKRFPWRFERQTLAEFKGAELLIVNPNYCHKWTSNDLAQFARPSLHTRLAWVVRWRSADMPPEAIAPMTFDFEVFIDAENGELLGGSYTL